MLFTKIAAQVVNTRVGSREGNGCDLVLYSDPLLFQILDPTLKYMHYFMLVRRSCTRNCVHCPQTIVLVMQYTQC
jgi:hypothetical protein